MLAARGLGRLAFREERFPIYQTIFLVIIETDNGVRISEIEWTLIRARRIPTHSFRLINSEV